MLIYTKGCYTILGNINFDSNERRLKFKVPFEDKSPVAVDIIPDENIVESFHEFEVSEKMWGVLQKDTYDGMDLHPSLQTELSEMALALSKATRKALHLIKYCFNNVELKDNLFSVKGVYWSENKSEWKMLPMIAFATLDIRNFIPLNKDTVRNIQNYIDTDFEPFLALKYLHRAKKETTPCFKWIDATIAAELAIKEFLIKKTPEIKTLLLEVPSPHLGKLYGPILKKYGGEKSPKNNEMHEGASIRNQLIHKPNPDNIVKLQDKKILIDDKKANKYIQDVEIAIYHLLTLLYPDDSIMKTFYKPRVVLD